MTSTLQAMCLCKQVYVTRPDKRVTGRPVLGSSPRGKSVVLALLAALIAVRDAPQLMQCHEWQRGIKSQTIEDPYSSCGTFAKPRCRRCLFRRGRKGVTSPGGGSHLFVLGLRWDRSKESTV